MWQRAFIIALSLSWSVAGTAQAQTPTPTTLTLKQAQDLAVNNHPQIKAAAFRALAARALVVEVKSVYYPMVQGAMTGVEAESGSRIAAGFFNNPTILSRYADGVMVNQFVTDFGHTGKLVQTSNLRASAQDQNTVASRAEVLVVVNQAYFGALRAQSVLKVAQETVAARQAVTDQVAAMEKNGLKSGLDLSFAQVNLSQAKLLLIQAQNDFDAANALLNAALGSSTGQVYKLVEEPLPPALVDSVATLVNQAIRDRPDLLSLRLDRDADFKFVDAERTLWYPTISSVAAAGVAPVHVAALQNNYAAAGINVSIPIFNGHLFSARRAEAEYTARASDQNVRDQENLITRDVRIAWLNANTTFQALAVTAQLLTQAVQSMDLAQARYNLGLSSIVELSQAQLNLTQAQIADAAAKFDYQVRRAELDYQIGALR
jgi:outer membrane protein